MKKSTFGQMSKDIRKSLNITQETMSKKLGISRGYLSEIEIGAKNPSLRLRMELRTMHLQHCAFKKPEPLVEVMVPEQPKLSWFKRFIKWVLRR